MKTIEVAARNYSTETVIQETDASLRELREYAEQDFKAGVDFAQRWIAPQDDLPDVGILVQIKLTEFVGDAIHYDHDMVIDVDGHKMFGCEQCAVKVLGWRAIDLK